MYDNLNARTRELVVRLTSNESVELGGSTVDVFSDEEASMLSILAENLRVLEGLSGRGLADKVLELLEEREAKRSESEDGETGTCEREEPVNQGGGESIGWRIGWLRACSFRGLAPAGMEWEYDFGGKSHLLYGPNGCGKSSLLGAISWCLTRRIFRDDCPPSVPENVKVFPVSERRPSPMERPDALALMDESGGSTSPGDDYWVEMQLVGKDSTGRAKEIWIRRHSSTGLAKSPDGADWAQIEALDDAGIDELDAELHVLMPARVSHMRFGKNKDLVHTLSEIVGLDDLERITRLAERVGRALRTAATSIQNSELAAEKARIADVVQTLKQASTEALRTLRQYQAVIPDTRELKDVKALQEWLGAAIHKAKKEVAEGLGIKMPDQADPDYMADRDKFDNLPGQVQTAIDELKKPLAELFPSSLGFVVPSETQLEELEDKLREFEGNARKQVCERLQWAIEEKKERRASLMLAAAEHFPEGSNDCPVCTQDLSPVPHVKAQLEALRALAARSYLRPRIEDMERGLVAALERVVPGEKRGEAAKTFSERIWLDWRALKEERFTGCLSPIAEAFDNDVRSVADSAHVQRDVERPKFAETYATRFPDTFTELDHAVYAARRYIQLCRSVIKSRREVDDSLARLVVAERGEEQRDSFRAIFERARAASRDVTWLTSVDRTTGSLERVQKNMGQIGRRMLIYRIAAEAADATKQVGEGVRGEVIAVVKRLESQMRGHFSRLYDNEILCFDMLTTGHAANPNIKDEMNVYVLAGSERVPVGPFCNQGRMRALTLSLVFALLEKSTGSLGVVVLDDPSLALDKEHNARFVDHLIEPLLGEKQVLLATHYESFFKIAVPVFADAERLQMPPRRSEADSVAFEPGDLLQRVDRSLVKRGCSWREVGINLRRWAERTLATLSGYCPEPFAKFNDIPGTVEAYARIADPNVATAERNEVVAALKSVEFRRVMHSPAHDEEVAETDVRDGLTVLQKCEKAVWHEIDRFKTLYQHHLLGRAVDARPTLEVLSLKDRLEACELNIVGTAAAAHNGVGVLWGEHLTTELAGLQAAIITLDTISPIAQIGQCLLLDPVDNPPEDGDLVVVETEDGKRYVRRYWTDDDHNVFLEAANPTEPYGPINLTEGKHSMRRIVGVLFRAANKVGRVGDEWVPRSFPSAAFEHALGVRVKGDCLKPILRDRQVALVRELDKVSELDSGQLACIDITDVGTVIKCCYPSHSEWILSAVNPNDVEAPMRVNTSDIRQIHKIIGALFELSNEREEGG
ncbi:AAA family ATPase [bacterium]|nr:AAA family ATPase [bacterium]